MLNNPENSKVIPHSETHWLSLQGERLPAVLLMDESCFMILFLNGVFGFFFLTTFMVMSFILFSLFNLLLRSFPHPRLSLAVIMVSLYAFIRVGLPNGSTSEYQPALRTLLLLPESGSVIILSIWNKVRFESLVLIIAYQCPGEKRNRVRNTKVT